MTAEEDEDCPSQTDIALFTLSLVTLLFLFGWFAGSNTCKSAVVGRPGFTTVISVSSGTFVSCKDKGIQQIIGQRALYFREIHE